MIDRLIRFVRRFFPKHRPITITGIHLHSGDDDCLYVDAEIDGQWITVIRDFHCEGGITSHIVEPLGMRCAADAHNRAQKRNPVTPQR